MTSTITSATATGELLTDEMLARFDKRAPQYDRDNEFFAEDFTEPRDSVEAGWEITGHKIFRGGGDGDA